MRVAALAAAARLAAGDGWSSLDRSRWRARHLLGTLTPSR